MATDDGAAAPTTNLDEGRTDEDRRFLLELEFVQCLANPAYLHFLAQHGLLDKPGFVNYLEYLMYWKQPQYGRYLQYPHCLFFLDLLQEQEYRAALKDPAFIQMVEWQQYRTWLSQLGTAEADPAAAEAAMAERLKAAAAAKQAATEAAETAAAHEAAAAEAAEVAEATAADST